MEKKQPILEVRHLTKVIGKKKIVDDLTLQVNPGEVFGFLGPNGAGKTTTIRMIVGLIDITKGKVLVNGINLKENKGVQVTKGDVEQWHKEKNSSNLPKYNFGENGCWVADEDGELEYVDNEHFTEEMKEEMKKMALRNATKANLNANGMTL